MKKNTASQLILEPQEAGGLMLRICTEHSMVYEAHVAHGADVVGALAPLRTRFKKISAVIVRSHIGSFSASRSALVVANVFAAIHGVPIHFVEHACGTPEEVARALGSAGSFSYAREAHITTST